MQKKPFLHSVLVIEAEPTLQNMLVSALRAEEYFVLILDNAMLALEIVQKNPFSLIILDALCSPPSWSEFAHKLKGMPTGEYIPLLLLIADGSEAETMVPTTIPVDDVLKKPLNWKEFHACVRELLRGRRRIARHPVHTSSIKYSMSEQQETVLSARTLSIDAVRRHVSINGQVVELQNSLLFDLLWYLMRHRGMIVTREQLLTHVWGYKETNDTRTVDVHMRWLRKKLQDSADQPQFIETVRGVGYRFKE